ncbi:MAG: nicotinate-nucleotide adenylyltransferase [Lachnospiraceae bacterium]|nr:nicotinate-nucleotide adenylyltransferase [Lachnospiraceae bacterium]
MKIGLVGGTFDPIHRGHVLLGEYARQQFHLDGIWFLPAGQPYFKEGKKVSPAADRLAMTRRALDGLDWARVCDMELRREGRTYTCETVEQLNAAFPQHEFSFIFGADCLDQLDSWRAPERILAGARIIAASRGSGADHKAMERKAAALMERFGGEICVMPFLELDVSSTLVRERMRDGKDVSDLLPEAVAAYAERQGLYRDDAPEAEKPAADPAAAAAGAQPSFSAVIFDMDGTLLDTERLFIDAWEEAEGNASPALHDALVAIIGVTRERSEEIIYERLGRDYPYEARRLAVDEVFRRARENGTLPVKAGAAQILRTLWRKGYKMGLASSTERELVIPELEAAGLTGYFDAVICGGDAARGKPAPDIFLKAAQAVHTDPARCLAVEDSRNGILAAHAAGMIPLMVPDLIPPDAELRALAAAVCPDLAAAEKWIAARET